MKIKSLILLSICLNFIFADDNIDIKESEQEVLVNDQLKSLDNKRIDIYDFIDNGPMLISFWFLACEPCKEEMKFLDIFNQQYASRGFKVVSINTDNSRGFRSVKPFIENKKYSFEVLSDPNGKYQQKLGGRECPFTVLVDHKGNILSKHVGFKLGDEQKIEKEILTLIDIYENDPTIFNDYKDTIKINLQIPEVE